MHELFLNYRTEGGGKEAAYICDTQLSVRFGSESIFRAQKSIDLGADYNDALINGVRRSRVLLALIGPKWLDAPDRERPGHRALENPKDWVRREIEEAFASGVLVVPVLVGRQQEQIERLRLPKSLAGLAECQYERLVSTRTADTDLARIGDRLVRQVPELAAVDRRRAADRPAKRRSVRPDVRNRGQSGGIGNVNGDVGTFVNESHGPLHTGSGDQINGLPTDQVGW
ncbi:MULTISPECIES: TIR domain-containing protein [unclassified Streptomyces]|uniref:Toll/interleukin-1 receptor domain-containing protein n=1 Tax=Streptomyces sp. NBC_00060 TaxID=2975636 RepID=A0AAU2H7Q7_9ACTN